MAAFLWPRDCLFGKRCHPQWTGPFCINKQATQPLTDMSIGLSDLESPSIKTPFSGDCRWCQVTKLRQYGHSGLELCSVGILVLFLLIWPQCKDVSNSIPVKLLLASFSTCPPARKWLILPSWASCIIALPVTAEYLWVSAPCVRSCRYQQQQSGERFCNECCHNGVATRPSRCRSRSRATGPRSRLPLLTVVTLQKR